MLPIHVIRRSGSTQLDFNKFALQTERMGLFQRDLRSIDPQVLSILSVSARQCVAHQSGDKPSHFVGSFLSIPEIAYEHSTAMCNLSRTYALS